MKNDLVIDTTTLIGAARKGSIPSRVLALALQRYTLVLSAKTMSELADVANRTKIINSFGVRNLRQLLRTVGGQARHDTHRVCLEPFAPDVKDTKFLELALATQAQAIVTGDHHLLQLKHFSVRGRPTVQIWTPRQFLETELAMQQAQRMRRQAFMRP